MRAEFIRYIFAYTDTPYEEVTIGFEEWFSTLKQSKKSLLHFYRFTRAVTAEVFFVLWNTEMPMHILPVLELSDGRQLSQSLAISRYLGTELGKLVYNLLAICFCLETLPAVHFVYRVRIQLQLFCLVFRILVSVQNQSNFFDVNPTQIHKVKKSSRPIITNHKKSTHALIKSQPKPFGFWGI